MTDPNHEISLRRLAATPVPPASAQARARAIAAAGAAFDAALAETGPAKIDAASAKGLHAVQRPRSSPQSGWWRTTMHNRLA
jgi:hypothetical protein